jgi:hypothetical protein
VAPVVAVDLGRPDVATADLRALLGTVVGGGRPATEPVSDRALATAAAPGRPAGRGRRGCRAAGCGRRRS